MNEPKGWMERALAFAVDREDESEQVVPRRVIAPGKRSLTQRIRRAEGWVPQGMAGAAAVGVTAGAGDATGSRDGEAAGGSGSSGNSWRSGDSADTGGRSAWDAAFDFLDPVAARAEATRGVIEDAARALGVTPVVHVGEAGRAATEGHRATTRGLALGDSVHVHPEVDVATEVGRRIALHEVVHLAQARLPMSGARAEAEAEADALAASAARGGRLEAPRLGLDLTRAAADDDVDVAAPSLAYEWNGQLWANGKWSVKVKRQRRTALVQGGAGDRVNLKQTVLDSTLQARMSDKALALKTEVLSSEGAIKVFDGLKLSIKVTGLEASLSTSRPLDVKVMKLAVVATGTDLPWLRDLFPPPMVAEVKLQGELALSADLLAKVAKELAPVEKLRGELHQTLDEQDEVLERLDERKRGYQATEREVAEHRRAAKRAKPGPARKAHQEAAREAEKRLKAQRDEVGKLGRRLEQLEQRARKLRKSFEVARGGVKTRIGRAVAKGMSKALASRAAKLAFKALPIIGWVSTVSDLYDIGRGLWRLWGGGRKGMGKGNADRPSEGGEEGARREGGKRDGGADGVDGGSVDGGSVDGGSVDGGSVDGGSVDGGADDAADVGLDVNGDDAVDGGDGGDGGVDDADGDVDTDVDTDDEDASVAPDAPPDAGPRPDAPPTPDAPVPPAPADTGAAKESKDPGAAKESKDPGAAKEAKEPGAAKEAKEPGAAKESKEPGGGSGSKRDGDSSGGAGEVTAPVDVPVPTAPADGGTGADATIAPTSSGEPTGEATGQPAPQDGPASPTLSPGSAPAPSTSSEPGPSSEPAAGSAPAPAPAPAPTAKKPSKKPARRKAKRPPVPARPARPGGVGGIVAPRAPRTIDDRALWSLSSSQAQAMVTWDGRALRPSKTYASFVARLAAAPLVQASSVGETIYLRWVELIIGAPADGKVPYTFEYFAFRAVDRGGFERVAQHSQTFVFDPNDGQTRRVTGDLDAALRGAVRVVDGQVTITSPQISVDGVGQFVIGGPEILETTVSDYRVAVDLKILSVAPGTRVVNAAGVWQELREGRAVRVVVRVPMGSPGRA